MNELHCELMKVMKENIGEAAYICESHINRIAECLIEIMSRAFNEFNTVLNNRPVPKIGDIFIHFKGDKYTIVDICRSVLDDRLHVIYKDITDDYCCYRRELSEFMSDIPEDRWSEFAYDVPDSEHHYKFKLISENSQSTSNL